MCGAGPAPTSPPDTHTHIQVWVVASLLHYPSSTEHSQHACPHVLSLSTHLQHPVQFSHERRGVTPHSQPQPPLALSQQPLLRQAVVVATCNTTRRVGATLNRVTWAGVQEGAAAVAAAGKSQGNWHHGAWGWAGGWGCPGGATANMMMMCQHHTQTRQGSC
jgi:hypothetical protein